EEQQFLTKRLEEDAAVSSGEDVDNDKNQQFSYAQFKSVFHDYKTYLHMLEYIGHTTPFYSLSLFLPTIIGGMGFTSSSPSAVAWITNNFQGYTRRAVATALIISFGNIGGLIAGQIYRNDDAPKYIRGHSIVLVFTCTNILASLVLKFLLKRENRRRDNLSEEDYQRECSEKKKDWHPDFRITTLKISGRALTLPRSVAMRKGLAKPEPVLPLPPAFMRRSFLSGTIKPMNRRVFREFTVSAAASCTSSVLLNDNPALTNTRL
ncbi:unnamed protein product, partial [Didymodactylos carnosus]